MPVASRPWAPMIVSHTSTATTTPAAITDCFRGVREATV